MKKTNKTFKRFAAITSASLLAACAMAPVFTSMTSYAAENTITITKNDNVAHSYTLYKLFSGKVETATGTTPIQGNIGNPTLGGKIENVAWADGVNVADIKTALSGLTEWTTPTEDTPAAYAKAITTWAVSADRINALAKLLADNKDSLSVAGTSTTGIIECEEDGYYIIVETPVGLVDGSTTCHLLGTYDSAVGAEINVKASKPSVEKKVKENTKFQDASNAYGVGYNDVADYTIGDPVPFKLIATLPSDIDIYDKYYIEFTDNLGAGFEAPEKLNVNINNIDYEVELANNEGTLEGSADSGNIVATVTGADTTGWNIVVKVLNVQKYNPNNEALVTVTYDAKLDADAAIGRPGNYNDVYLSYSNNPNNTGNGTSAPTDLGKTDKDGVVVFTYQLDIHKYDSADADKALLANAKFVLSNAEGKYLSVDANNDYSWITVTPPAEGDINWDETEVKIYTSTAETDIRIPGLDDGTYTLTEISAPTGFNPITPLELVITATTDNGQNHDAIGPNADTSEPADGKGDGRNGDQLTKIELLNTASTPVTYDTNANGGTIAEGETGHDNFGGNLLTDGNVMVEVANSSGTTLPGTGGIGTTIFYLGGGAMAAIGGIYLISKRRMRKSEE